MYICAVDNEYFAYYLIIEQDSAFIACVPMNYYDHMIRLKTMVVGNVVLYSALKVYTYFSIKQVRLKQYWAYNFIIGRDMDLCFHNYIANINT